jgi:hypothetical protein
MCFFTMFQNIDCSYLSLLELFIFSVYVPSIRSTAPVSGHFKFLCLLYESVWQKIFWDHFKALLSSTEL